MTELNHETFDITSVLAGISFPTHKVHVYFNAQLGFAITTLNDGIALAERLNEEAKAKKLQKELDKLLKEVVKERYTVHLKGIPEAVKTNIFDKIYQEFPTKTDVFGREEPNFGREKAFNKAMWEAHIVEIEDPSGAKSFVTPASIETLIEQAPENVIKAVNDGIDELTKGTKGGFEFAASEVAFL